MAKISIKDVSNLGWNVHGERKPNGRFVFTAEQLQLVLLQEIRDELKTLNALLHCPNFQAIPKKLDAIRLKLPARKKRARKG